MGWTMGKAACAALCIIFAAVTANAQPTGPKTLLVAGDSQGDCLNVGLNRLLRGKKTYTLVNRSKVSSGLARPDFYDWVAEAKAVADAVKPDVALVIMGGNDIQALRNGKKWVTYGTPEWEKIYRSRIDAVTKPLKKSAQVFWVGMPVIRNQKLNKGVQFLDTLYAEHAKRNGITFIPIRSITAAKDGAYRSHYKDSKGRTRKMRHDDGIHFTVAGCIHLSDYILTKAEAVMKGASAPSKKSVLKDKP